MTGRHTTASVLPPAAEAEIMGALSARMRISSDEIAAILKKHSVSGDIDALQDRYRKQLGQHNWVPAKPRGFVGRGGARERAKFSLQVETEWSGLCDDEAGIRDESGKRLVLSAGQEYVVVECCNDRQKLQKIQHRLQAQMNGLNTSTIKVRGRVRVLGRLSRQLRKAG